MYRYADEMANERARCDRCDKLCLIDDMVVDEFFTLCVDCHELGEKEFEEAYDAWDRARH